MAKIEARCTQCGSTDFGDNSYTYNVDSRETKHGSGSVNGCEELVCPQCSGSCDRYDDCEYEEPCEKCATKTVHNRCGSSVPTVSR